MTPENEISTLKHVKRVSELITQAIIELIKGGKLNSTNYLNVSSLEIGQTLPFRILPSWNWKSGDTRFANFVARHWGGVTEAEVNGTVKVNIAVEESPHERSDLPFTPDAPTERSTGKKKCLGNVDCFDESSDDCKVCSDFKECHKEVLKKSIM